MLAPGRTNATQIASCTHTEMMEKWMMMETSVAHAAVAPRPALRRAMAALVMALIVAATTYAMSSRADAASACRDNYRRFDGGLIEYRNVTVRLCVRSERIDGVQKVSARATISWTGGQVLRHASNATTT